MAHEPAYEDFHALAADGHAERVQFKKAGFLSIGDQPEVYFFEVNGSQTIVAISGQALRQLQTPPRRAFSREEKIDLAGLRLKREIESGRRPVPSNIYIEEVELQALARELGFVE